MAWFEFKGERLDGVTFGSGVREHLANELDGYKAAEIIARLEDIAACIPALAAPDRDAVRFALDARSKAVRAILKAFDRRQETADGLIASALMQRGRTPEEVGRMLRSFQATITDIGEALDSIAERLSRRRGGAPADSQARWLVDNTIRELERAGVPVTRDQEDGTLAKILRILWPVVLKRDAPTELRPWLKPATSRR